VRYYTHHAPMQESQAEAARDIVVPRATCSALSRRCKMSFLFPPPLPLPRSALPPLLLFLFVASRLGLSLLGRCGGSVRGAINSSGARLHPALPRSVAIPDSLFFPRISIPCARISGRGLGFMALVNPWRAVLRSLCRFFFN
jgi:hypothetical protein